MPQKINSNGHSDKNTDISYHESQSDSDNNVTITIKKNDIQESELIIERFSNAEVELLDDAIKKYKEKAIS